MALAGGAPVKSRWDEDTVFRQHVRDDPATRQKQREAKAVNDTLRSDKHRDFMKKMVR